MEPVENRSAAFWRAVASAPECAGALFGAAPETLDDVIASPAVLPLATEHGGFLFLNRDAFGRVKELHTLFTREGWGHEVSRAAKSAFERVLADADIIFTQEVVGEWRTRPPRSFGFRAAGPEFAADLGIFRCWYLTRDAWLESPARLRWKAN
jgi:hypothetical protein